VCQGSYFGPVPDGGDRIRQIGAAVRPPRSYHHRAMIEVPREMLEVAIMVYLRCAYPDGQVPDVVRKRVALDRSRPLAELLGDLPFERYESAAPFPCTVFALRLGAAHYPHIKMEIRPFPNQHGFVFWVNTHDQFFTPDARCRDGERWREVVSRNRELKQAVERAWAEGELPTFVTAMQESIAQASQQVRTEPRNSPVT
jgi:hypothetical protein